MWKEISGVEMPVQDPVYGKNGPLVQLWNEASQEYAKEPASKL